MIEESKSQKFKRVAGNRTNKILDLIRILGNCSNTSIYEYTQEDVNKIFTAIETELKAAKQKYQVSTNRKKFVL